jgi:hypothetical protein
MTVPDQDTFGQLFTVYIHPDQSSEVLDPLFRTSYPDLDPGGHLISDPLDPDRDPQHC